MIYCAVSPDLEGKGGTYYGPPYMSTFTANVLNTAQCHPHNDEAKEPELRHRLYDEVLKIVNDTASKLEVKLALLLCCLLVTIVMQHMQQASRCCYLCTAQRRSLAATDDKARIVYRLPSVFVKQCNGTQHLGLHTNAPCANCRS
eukprot:GHUV01053684.1.p1 GENE.GHUV01053684.1~~GHUV01053684.1.p1  ORF type:complete len:145 (+),score=16.59 GHUV01053684.1:1040-1474(+)